MTGSDYWYDPLDLKQLNETFLKKGFSWTSENQTVLSFVVTGMVFALAPDSDYSGLVSRMNFQEVSCARSYAISP